MVTCLHVHIHTAQSAQHLLPVIHEEGGCTSVVHIEQAQERVAPRRAIGFSVQKTFQEFRRIRHHLGEILVHTGQRQHCVGAHVVVAVFQILLDSRNERIKQF